MMMTRSQADRPAGAAEGAVEILVAVPALAALLAGTYRVAIRLLFGV